MAVVVTVAAALRHLFLMSAWLVCGCCCAVP